MNTYMTPSMSPEEELDTFPWYKAMRASASVSRSEPSCTLCALTSILTVARASHSRAAACSGLSARFPARTCTEPTWPHSSSTAGHALTLTLCTFP